MKKRMIALALCLALLVSLAACGNKESGMEDVIKVGVVGERNEAWQDVAKRFEEKEGKKIELVVFTDYNQPNDALAAGDIDLNSFQHKKFLNNYNEEKGENLAILGDTILAPLGLYSTQINTLEEIKEKDKIAIPDDVSNLARSLFLLQSAGLIKVKGNPGDPVDLEDIIENPLELEIIPMNSNQTARSLDDVIAATINNDMSQDAGLSVKEDTIFVEKADEDSAPYINVIAVREEDKDNALYQKLLTEYYQTEETAKVIEEAYQGGQIPAWKE